jgi:hypothetical protein
LIVTRFMIGSLLFSLLPVLVGMGMHAADCYNFLMEEDEEERENIIMWQVGKLLLQYMVLGWCTLSIEVNSKTVDTW